MGFACHEKSRKDTRAQVKSKKAKGKRQKVSNVYSARSAIVLLINRKDYEHFNKVWGEIARVGVQ